MVAQLVSDPMETLRSTPMGLDRFQAQELARPERLEEVAALLGPGFAGTTAARVLALSGSEAAVPALSQAAQTLPNPEFLRPLADCGPSGRAELRRLARARGELGRQALLAMAARLDRPASRPVLLQALTDLGTSDTPESRVAGMAVLLCGWLSGARRLLGEEVFEEHLEELAFPRPPLTSTPQEALPLPGVARGRVASHQAISAMAERRKALTRAFREDLAAMQPVASARPEAGRNDPCPCGSGRKFKKCCLDTQETTRRRSDQLERLGELEELFGFVEPPTREPDAPRLLELLSRDGRGPWAAGHERPLVRWASAWRRLYVDRRAAAVDDLVELLEALPAPGVDADDALFWLLWALDRSQPEALARLIPGAARLGSAPVLSMLAAVLEPEGELGALLEEVLAGGRGPDVTMAILETAMEKEEGPELAEEALPFLRHAAAEDPAWQDSLEAVLEWTRTRLWRPTPVCVVLPEGVELPWWADLEEAPPEPARLARRLRLVSTWTEGFEDVTEDSLPALEEERRLRTELALRTAAELAQAMEAEDAATARLVAERRDALLLLVGEEGLDWIPPEGNAIAVAEAAGMLASELGLDLPIAVEVEGRPALRQGGLAGRHADLGVTARVALEEACCEPPETLLRVVGRPLAAGPALDPPDVDEVLAEKARRAGLHPLELAAELSARGRPVTRREAPSAPVVSAAPSVPVVAPVEPSPDLPVALAEDPVPARKALRRVLRRLFRTGKIGEAHTSVDLVSRGVAGHLRGAVKDSVDLLLARGILRDKPTLVGQHTSIEPRHVAAVERFVEEGWLPDARLADLLGVGGA